MSFDQFSNQDSHGPMRQLRAFLSHNSADKPTVEEVARRLVDNGLECWLDKWNLIPGSPWQQAIEEALHNCSAFVVFIGPSGLGPWQNEEMRFAIDARVRESNGQFRVVPVLLPGGRRDQRSRLPSFLVASTWVEFRSSLDEEDPFRRLVCGIRGVEPGAGAREAVYEGQCPYRGLQAFQPEHARYFFGREARIEWLLNKFRSDFGTTKETRFLGIVGASGSGKSSLAGAGLIPAIQKGQLDASSDWPIILCRPGNDPLQELALSLAKPLSSDSAFREAIPDVGDTMDRLAAEQRRLHLITRLALHNAPETRRALVVVDQFEEVFTQCPDEVRRRAFIDNLLYASSVTLGRTIVVLAMRADFYGRCSAYPELATALSDYQELVPPMTEDELRRAIERPAQLTGCELEPGLTEILLQDMKSQAGALPLLQDALRQLWDRRAGRKMTVEAYKSIGKLEGAIQKYADRFFLALDKSEQETCRRIFMRLTQPGEGSEDTKRRAHRNELGQDAAADAVVQKLATARLITTEGKKSDAGSWVEVSHERLFRSWTRLRDWVNSNRESIRTQHRLSAAAIEWDQGSRDEALLLRGARLAEAEEWSTRPDSHASRLEQAFLQESIVRRDREVSARLRKLTAGLLGAATLAVVMTILAVYAFRTRNEAISTRVEAETLLRSFRGFTDETLQDGNPEKAIQKLVDFVENYPENPEYKVLLADSYNIRGEFLRKTGNPSDAEPLFLEAKKLLDQLEREYPIGREHRTYQHERARTLYNLGAVLMISGRGDAKEYFLDAIKLLSSSPTQGQQDSELNDRYRQDLARSHNNLAMLLSKQDPSAAEGQYKLAIETSRDAKCAFELVRWQNNYAAFLNDRERFEDSIRVINEALKLGKKRKPRDAELGFEHARSLHINASACSALGRKEEARESLESAETICEELTQVLAVQHSFQSVFGQVLYERALLLVDDLKLEEGVKLLERAVTRHQVASELAPGKAIYRENLYSDFGVLAETYVKLKNHERAFDAATELPGLKPEKGEGHYWKGYFLAKCGDIAEADAKVSEKYIVQAINSVTKAKSDGWPINPEDWAGCEAIRDRPEFKELLPQ